MKKTMVALAAVMMMGGTIAYAQQPEKNGSNDQTTTEQPAPETEKPADETCPEKCGDQAKSAPSASVNTAAETAATAR